MRKITQVLKEHRFLAHTAVACMVVALGSACARSEEGSCRVLQESFAKLESTSTHIYSSVFDGVDGTTTSLEMIQVRGVVYAKTADGWMKTALTPKDMVGESLQPRVGGSCVFEKDDSLNGQSVAKFRVQSQGNDAKGQVWISKSSGLPVRQDIEIKSNGNGRNTRTSTRFEYKDVVAPRI